MGQLVTYSNALLTKRKKKCLEAKDWENLRENSPPTEDKQV